MCMHMGSKHCERVSPALRVAPPPLLDFLRLPAMATPLTSNATTNSVPESTTLPSILVLEPDILARIHKLSHQYVPLVFVHSAFYVAAKLNKHKDKTKEAKRVLKSLVRSAALATNEHSVSWYLLDLNCPLDALFHFLIHHHVDNPWLVEHLGLEWDLPLTRRMLDCVFFSRNKTTIMHMLEKDADNFEQYHGYAGISMRCLTNLVWYCCVHHNPDPLTDSDSEDGSNDDPGSDDEAFREEFSFDPNNARQMFNRIIEWVVSLKHDSQSARFVETTFKMHVIARRFNCVWMSDCLNFAVPFIRSNIPTYEWFCLDIEISDHWLGKVYMWNEVKNAIDIVKSKLQQAEQSAWLYLVYLSVKHWKPARLWDVYRMVNADLQRLIAHKLHAIHMNLIDMELTEVSRSLLEGVLHKFKCDPLPNDTEDFMHEGDFQKLDSWKREWPFNLPRPR